MLYAHSRQGHSYAPDYFVKSATCGDRVETSLEYQDYVKGLEVGGECTYNVAVFLKDYMVDTDLSNGRFVRNSDPTSLTHTVAWEGSAKVLVTMTREAGSLPLEGAALTWQLLKINHDVGTEVVIEESSTPPVSPENGIVKIPLKVPHPKGQGITGNTKLALRIWPSKVSKGTFSNIGRNCTGANNARFDHLNSTEIGTHEYCEEQCLKMSLDGLVGLDFSSFSRECHCLYSDGFYTFVGTGKCLNASENEYISAVSLTLSGDTNSVNKCVRICTDSAAFSGRFLVGFELTPGVSCNCRLSQREPMPFPTLAATTEEYDWIDITGKECAPYDHLVWFKVVMGDITDFYKLKPGATLCSALDSSNKFLSSTTFDGNYVDVGDTTHYYAQLGGKANIKGGSPSYWPKNNVDGDECNYLPFWGLEGQISDGTNGCCFLTKEGDYKGFGLAFKIFVLSDWIDITGKECKPYDHLFGFKVVMGDNTDFYKPKPGETVCSALDSSNKFLWSATLDGDYIDAGDYESNKGGSPPYWPKENVDGDECNYLPFWGKGQVSNGTNGCCYLTKEGGYKGWGLAFKIFVLVEQSGSNPPSASNYGYSSLTINYSAKGVVLKKTTTFLIYFALDASIGTSHELCFSVTARVCVLFSSFAFLLLLA